MKKEIIILIIVCLLVFTSTYIVVERKIVNKDLFEIDTPKTVYTETMSDTKGILFIINCNNDNNIYATVSKGLLNNDNDDIKKEDNKYILSCKDKVYWSNQNKDDIAIDEAINVSFKMNSKTKSFTIKYNNKNEYVLYDN